MRDAWRKPLCAPKLLLALTSAASLLTPALTECREIRFSPSDPAAITVAHDGSLLMCVAPRIEKGCLKVMPLGRVQVLAAILADSPKTQGSVAVGSNLLRALNGARRSARLFDGPATQPTQLRVPTLKANECFLYCVILSGEARSQATLTHDEQELSLHNAQSALAKDEFSLVSVLKIDRRTGDVNPL
jgi:hypothetical protein